MTSSHCVHKDEIGAGQDNFDALKEGLDGGGGGHLIS